MGADEVGEVTFEIGDRTVVYVRHEPGGDVVVVRGPQSERQMALRGWVNNEGLIAIDAASIRRSEPVPERPFKLHTPVLHEDGWGGTVDGYGVNGMVLVRRSESWREVVSPEKLTAVEGVRS